MITPLRTPHTLEDHQREVQRLLGGNILRLQLYEQQLKALIAASDFTIEISRSGKMRRVQGIPTEGVTLGQLVGKLCGAILIQDQPPAISGNDTTSEAFMSYRQTLRSHMDPDCFTEFSGALRELVTMRNTLVHHFIEGLDLLSIDGCLAAQIDLKAKLEITRQRLDQLSELTHELAAVQAMTNEVMNSDLMRGLVARGDVPWGWTDIVAELRAATLALAVDGWTAVDAAVQWIKTRDPTQGPQHYGCSNWRHLIHASGLFDLRYEKTGDKRVAHYRARHKAGPR